MFNISKNVVIAGLMGVTYIALGGEIGKFLLIPALVIIAIEVIASGMMMSNFLALIEGGSTKTFWKFNIKDNIGKSFILSSLGIVIILAYIKYGYGGVLLFFIPIMLIRYLFSFYVKIKNMYVSTIQAFNSVMEAKDPYTYGHGARVGRYAVELAEAYGLAPAKIQDIKYASLLHDIGKIGVNDSILNKPSKLTEEEYDEIKMHPETGAEIIRKVDFLKNASVMIRYHHERYDGKGYPEGLIGEEIPIGSSIIGVVDAFDAMTSERPYRSAITKKAACQEIKRNSGSQFHPELADLFCKIIEKGKIFYE